MKFIIELDVVFSPEDKTLSLSNEPNNSVAISNQANRLLLEMITRKNEMLERNELIKKVWEDYGFTSSNNSLNVAVSEIRKAFSSLGKDPKIISTIPKVGLQFVGDVAPVINKHEELTDNVTSNQNDYLLFANKKIVFFLAFFALLYLGLYTYNRIKNNLTTTQEYKKLVFTQNKCDVYALGHQSYDMEEIKNNTSQLLKNCATQRAKIFYERVNNSSVFIAACTLKNQDEYLKCITIKKQY
ncbi:winged helix-turn-helix domain-containing protein [Enterobacter roggenkampii]|uniref:winged helix-turn-helix domain-containing protein n=1 Tax=Enterobacter roggenkampii TaxID=1812935 RepID=UPI00069A2185|nr:winged helix-turn-helix domain-containing protein [Enterobacter roggenkampii]